MTLPVLKWRASPNFSHRNGARVDLLVCHDTEGGYDGSVAWLCDPRSQVSAHFVLKEDGSEATQLVDIADKAWHACQFNSRSIGFEMGGWASKGFAPGEWQAQARVIAFHLHHLQIPCKWARGGIGPGFCSHWDLGAAGGGHRDPTTDPKVWAHFVEMVTTEYNQGNFPPIWQPEHDLLKCSLATQG